MISEGMVKGTTSPPSHEQIVNWAKYANETMSEVNIHNAWKHGQYSWCKKNILIWYFDYFFSSYCLLCNTLTIK